MRYRSTLFPLFVFLAACESAPQYRAPDAQVSSTAAAAASSSAPAPSAEPSASSAPSAAASAARSAEPVASAPAASASAAADTSGVKVQNIGMHIGGGPNDLRTKEPIAKSVEPHMGEFKKCFERVYDKKKGGDVGVDLLIPENGGKAKVTAPVRTKMQGERFTDCIKEVFEEIDFLKPRFGKTTVSYSLKFTP